MMTDIAAYEAALHSAVYFHQPQAGFLRVAGRDRVDFLQRQSTNDLRQLKPDRAVSTVLTSPTARILDLFCVIDIGDSLGVVTMPGRFAETSKFLRSRIFFSDQVRVDDLSEEFAQILLFGPQKDGVLMQLGLQSPASDEVLKCEIAGQPITMIGQKVLTELGCRFLVPATSVNAFMDALEGVGVVSLDLETFEILRVETGQPGPAGELLEAYTPLEVGLMDAISDSKGCYTGQEVITRQITYDKVSKNLVGVKLDEFIGAGVEIKVEGKSVGMLTSTALSPRFGPIGLAVVRRQYSTAGRMISIHGGDNSITRGKVAELVFQ